jgi:hypothetical protein
VGFDEDHSAGAVDRVSHELIHHGRADLCGSEAAAILRTRLGVCTSAQEKNAMRGYS